MLPRRLQNGFSLLALFLFASFGCSRAIRSPYQNSQPPRDAHAININTADTTTLESLPHIGHEFASKIVEHRTRYGPFRKPEHLLILDGMSEKRFNEIRDLIIVE